MEMDMSSAAEDCSSDVGITSQQALSNYSMAGRRVESGGQDAYSWESFQDLFNPDVRDMIDIVLEEIKFEKKLTCFQELFLHCIASKRDVFGIANTGAGKTEVTGLASHLLRKVYQKPTGLIVMFVPLTGILHELLDSDHTVTAIITMNGQMFGREGERRVAVKEEDIFSGKFSRLVMHPETLKNSNVENMMLKLKLNEQVIGVIIDEFHIILPGHWSSFRPGMEEQTARLRVFLRKGAPTGALSATATKEEASMTAETLGLRNEPVILAETPLQNHFKYILLHRPSDNYGFEGFTDMNKKYHAGLLDQLKIIYIDEFVRCILNNQEPKHGIIFFRTENQLIFLLNYLREILGQCIASTAPFVCLLSSTPPVTEMVISKRKGSIFLYLTTQKMLLGLNIPRLDICIFVKPMNMLHSIIQGGGRTGRPLPGEPGIRTRGLVYILANGGDVGAQVKGMSEEVRELVNNKNRCLKAYMGKYFMGNFDSAMRDSEWCCSFCSSTPH